MKFEIEVSVATSACVLSTACISSVPSVANLKVNMANKKKEDQKPSHDLKEMLKGAAKRVRQASKGVCMRAVVRAGRRVEADAVVLLQKWHRH